LGVDKEKKRGVLLVANVIASFVGIDDDKVCDGVCGFFVSWNAETG
jgi:hypothetical protein